MVFRLYNTLTRRIEPFVPADPSKISFYTCGPTVYDDAHIGNFRSFLGADLLRRWLESPLCTLETADGTPHQGPRTVTHVMNITDVGHMTDDADADGQGEDKMVVAARRITEAKKSGKIPPEAGVNPDDPSAVAGFYRERFLEDARALGLKVAREALADPSLMPRATDHIDAMKTVIRRLLAQGFAYEAGGAGARAVYFDVQKDAAYGRLSGNTLDKLRGGAGGRVDTGTQREKKHPADFLLWKEDPSHTMRWESPVDGWAEGYPGWHIECTAMALERLSPGGLNGSRGVQIDLHSGGEDNIFPHHECEIAQSCAFTGAPGFARHWFHPRFLLVDGKKMSKSKGTFFTPRELMARGIDPAAIRLELIKTHYRANADFSLQGLKDSQRQVARWRKEAGRVQGACVEGSLQVGYRIADSLPRMADALANDMNMAEFIENFNLSLTMIIPAGQVGALADIAEKTPLPTAPMPVEEALGLLNGSSRPIERDWAALHLIDNILGVIFRPVEEDQATGLADYEPGVTPSDEIESLLAERRDARTAKDFARSDAIRDRLGELGLTIKDRPDGRVAVGVKG